MSDSVSIIDYRALFDPMDVFFFERKLVENSSDRNHEGRYEARRNGKGKERRKENGLTVME